MSQPESCDVCIVGAGAAGAYLVRGLAERGLSVICLDAGPRRCAEPADVGFEPQFAADYYPGAIEGRAFGVGGSTSRWGGLLVPHSTHDCRDTDLYAESWRHIVATVTERTESVLSCMGYRRSPEFHSFSQRCLGDEEAGLRAAGLSVVTSLFLPFRRKNLAGLLEQSIRGSGRVKVLTSAVARDWTLGSDGSVKRLRAVSKDGRQLDIEAETWVVAAGAIESARILLELRETAPRDVLMSAAIGDCLADHLSVAVADVSEQDRPRVTSCYSPRFSGPWMRSFRFMETSPEPGTPRTFAHFVFENENPGFRLAKTVLTALQARRIPQCSLADLIAGTGGVAGLAWQRFVRNRLYVPSTTPARMQLDVEQTPNPCNRIRLEDSRDGYGRRKVQIDWRITEQDMSHVHRAAERLLSGWRAAGTGLPALIARDLKSGAEKPHDAYHPVGVCRMGTDSQAVVDLNLSVLGLNNLSCISTAVLPSAGTANPTFTMLCLADALVDRLTGSAVQTTAAKN